MALTWSKFFNSSVHVGAHVGVGAGAHASAGVGA